MYMHVGKIAIRSVNKDTICVMHMYLNKGTLSPMFTLRYRTLHSVSSIIKLIEPQIRSWQLYKVFLLAL